MSAERFERDRGWIEAEASPNVIGRGTGHQPWFADLLDAVEQILRLPTRGPGPWLQHRALSALHGLLAGASGAAAVGMPLSEMRELTVEARQHCAQYSRTLAHAQTWPRGYPGDFALIERLLDADPGGEPGTLERVLEGCVLQLPIMWQHRARVAWQAQLVRWRL